MLGTKIKNMKIGKYVYIEIPARKLGVPVSFIEKVENNEIDPKVGTIKRISDALEIDISLLFEEENKKNETKRHILSKKKHTIKRNKYENKATIDNYVEISSKEDYDNKELSKDEQNIKVFKDFYNNGYRFMNEKDADTLAYSMSRENNDGSKTVWTMNGLKKAAEQGKVTFEGKKLSPEDVDMFFNALVFVCEYAK